MRIQSPIRYGFTPTSKAAKQDQNKVINDFHPVWIKPLISIHPWQYAWIFFPIQVICLCSILATLAFSVAVGRTICKLYHKMIWRNAGRRPAADFREASSGEILLPIVYHQVPYYTYWVVINMCMRMSCVCAGAVRICWGCLMILFGAIRFATAEC